MTALQKIIASAALFMAWGALVVFGMAPVADYVTAIRDALIALGVFTASMSNPKE
jgi:hypothetical protein